MQECFRIYSAKHSTQDHHPQILPIKFYVFEDFTNPTTLLSYAASSRLGIVQFTVPKEPPLNFPSRINAIACNKTVTFSQHQEDRPQNSHNNRDSASKPIIKQPSQNHSSTDILQQDYFFTIPRLQIINSPLSGP